VTDPLHEQARRSGRAPAARPRVRTTGPTDDQRAPRRSDHADAVDTDDVHEFSARGDGDDRVHAVDVRSPESALIDPSPYTNPMRSSCSRALQRPPAGHVLGVCL